MGVKAFKVLECEIDKYIVRQKAEEWISGFARSACAVNLGPWNRSNAILVPTDNRHHT
jgi:hypothetical protein